MLEALEKIKAAEERNEAQMNQIKKELLNLEKKNQQLLQEKQAELQKKNNEILTERNRELNDELKNEALLLEEQKKQLAAHYQANFELIKAQAVTKILEGVREKYGSQ